MIKSILVANDGSEYSWSAWQYATDIARAYNAWVRVISVVDIRVMEGQTMVAADGFVPGAMQLIPNPDLEAEMDARHKEILETAKRKTESLGIPVTTLLARGIPADTICSHDSTVDLIAMGHHGDRSSLDRLLVGSVADAVVRRSSRPVLVTPSDYRSIDRILAAYDGSEAAKHALHWAADLANTLKLPVDVVHVGNSREVVESVLFEATEYLKPYNVPEVATFSSDGEVTEGILKIGQERNSGLIVMGAHGHSRLHEALLGSVTESMLQQTERPLLMTR